MTVGDRSALSRAAAAAIALAAGAGLTTQFLASLPINGSIAANLWVLARYFTVLTNLMVVLVFAPIAVGSRLSPAPWLLAGAVLSIMLVGVVYALLLRGSLELSGGARLADTLLHIVTPILCPLYWLAFAGKGELRYPDALRWLSFPAGYVAYALVRGAVEGRYAYPFIDAATLGPGRVAFNVVAIGITYMLCVLAFVWLDRRLGAAGGL